MRIFKYLVMFFMTMINSLYGVAQIGYQVSLLDTRTGEPRVNEKTSVVVKITDNKGNVVCDETKSVTSDSFGVLSLTVGNSNTFEKVNWNNLPLSISATVDGILISSSQILNVPVAEHSKHTGVLTPEVLYGKVCQLYNEKITFNGNGTATIEYYDYDEGRSIVKTCQYEIKGDNAYIIISNKNCWAFYYSTLTDKVYFIGGEMN